MRSSLAFSLILMSSVAANANCLGDGAASADDVGKFKANVGAYMAGMPNSRIQDTIRKMAATDASTLNGITQYLGTSSLTTQTAISNGLGEAAKACSNSVANEDQARDIQLAAANLPVVLREAFNRFAGLRSVGTAGAGAGASSGASGGQISGFGGTGTFGASTFPSEYAFANGPTTLPTPGSSSSSLTRSTTTTVFITNISSTTAITESPTSPTNPGIPTTVSP